MGQCCTGSKFKEKDEKALPDDDLKELIKATGLDVTELKKCHRDFVKDYPNGHLTRDQFKKIYQEFFPDDPKRENFAEKLFQTYDQNQDGTIDFREFMVALSLVSKGTVRQKLSLAFTLYDSNGDGVLSYEEIFDVVKTMYQLAGEAAGNEEVPSAETFAKRLFSELDKDSDGNITVEEFTEVGSQDVTLANLLLAKVVDDEEEQEHS